MSSPNHLLAAVLALIAAPGCLSVADVTESGTGGGLGNGGSVATGGTFPSSGGSGTGGGAGSENCRNGSDDDGDSKIDCADPDCAPGFECVEVPSGWDPVIASTSAWSASLPSPGACASGAPPVRYFEGPAGPPACVACACGSLSGATCGDTSISCAIGNTTCAGAQAINVGTCQDFAAPSNKEISCSLGTTPLSGGSCGSATTALVNPDPWQSVADACALKAGGCGAGEACVPKQTATEDVCLAIAGTASCPATWPTQSSAYTGGADSRACSDCNCAPNNVSCDPDKFALMTDTGCLDFGPFPTFSGAGCGTYTIASPLSPTTWSLKRQPAANKTATGTCSASGGLPSGSLSPVGQTTLCCR